jgi:glycosyltransferase involved in cell wall biosynthesis
MRISIAVPSRNYDSYLSACLESIRVQDHEDVEILIADGGSTDASLRVIQRFVESDGRFRLVSTSDDGQADAIGRALGHATGEVHGFLNADDVYLHPQALSRVARAFARDPAVDLVSFGGVYIDVHGAIIRPVSLRYHPLDGLRWLRFRASVLQPATFWHRKVSDAIPLRTEFQYVFDACFFYEAYERFTWAEYGDPIAGYRMHGVNKSAGIRSDRIKELARFERFKFGPSSWRARYLDGVARLVTRVDRIPGAAPALKRGIYLAVNSLSFASAYRVPGI